MAYRVYILQTGESFDAHADERLLDAATRQDVKLAHECTFGGCGTCRIKLVEGEVDYEEFPMALTAEEAKEGYALACQARATSDLVISADSAPQVCEPQRCEAVIAGVRRLGPDVTGLQLQLPDLPSFNYLPGQYMNVHLEDGSHRSFSMASVPQSNRVEFHVRRIPGGKFTQSRMDMLAPGDVLDVELPLGTFRYHSEDYRPIVMVATGTGLAPIKAILESLMEDPDCPPVWLYWGARTPDALYLDDEIRRWGERLYEFQYVPVLSRASADWPGRRGYVQDAVLTDIPDLSDHSVYLCGSPAMISDAKHAFLARGADLEHIYTDGFSFQHAVGERSGTMTPALAATP